MVDPPLKSTVLSTVNLLVVRKTTNLEWHGGVIRREVAAGRMPAEDLARLQRAHDEHYQTLEGLRARLLSQQIAFVEITRESDWPRSQKFDAVVTVGGNGTLLAASHNVLDDTLTVGVRSSRSSVGHLCAYGGDSLDLLVEDLKGRRCRTSRVTRIKAMIRRAGSTDTLETEPVLNDFLYCNLNPAATTRYLLRINDHVEEQKSSGIWVATAVGSSAAIAGAGGQTVPWSDRRIQFRVREVFSGGRMKPDVTSGFFDPTKDTMEIENRSERAFLALDGQHGEVPLNLGDIVRFCAAPELVLAVAEAAAPAN